MTALYLLGIDKILVSTLCSEGIKKGCLSFRLEMPRRLSNMDFHMAQDDKKASILLPNVVKKPNMANHNRATTVFGDVSIISRRVVKTIKLAQ